MKRIALFILIAASAAQASTLFLSYIPPSLNSGDTFDLLVSVAPDPGEEINTFSIDLQYSSFLSVDPISPATEDGYFAANGLFFSPGTTGSVSAPGMSGLFGISDVLAGGDFLPGADTLFDIVFTATSAGTPVVTVGPGSYLLDPNFNNVSIDNVVYLTPEPSTALAGGAALAFLAALGWRRRRA